MPTLNLAVGLGIVRRGPHMSHARDANELLEILGQKLRPVVGDDARFCFPVALSGPLQNDLDLGFGHRLLQFPVHDLPAITVQNTAQVVKRPTYIDVGNIYVPMLMRLQRLLEPRTLLRRFPLPGRQTDSQPATALATHSTD